jgi:hypothetical protein
MMPATGWWKTVNGAEGNKEAIHWLEKSNFEILKHIALAGDRDEDSLNWLTRNHPEFAMVAERIRVLKDLIEDSHNDVHSINRD